MTEVWPVDWLRMALRMTCGGDGLFRLVLRLALRLAQDGAQDDMRRRV